MRMSPTTNLKATRPTIGLARLAQCRLACGHTMPGMNARDFRCQARWVWATLFMNVHGEGWQGARRDWILCNNASVTRVVGLRPQGLPGGRQLAQVGHVRDEHAPEHRAQNACGLWWFAATAAKRLRPASSSNGAHSPFERSTSSRRSQAAACGSCAKKQLWVRGKETEASGAPWRNQALCSGSGVSIPVLGRAPASHRYRLFACSSGPTC